MLRWWCYWRGCRREWSIWSPAPGRVEAVYGCPICNRYDVRSAMEQVVADG